MYVKPSNWVRVTSSRPPLASVTPVSRHFPASGNRLTYCATCVTHCRKRVWPLQLRTLWVSGGIRSRNFSHRSLMSNHTTTEWPYWIKCCSIITVLTAQIIIKTKPANLLSVWHFTKTSIQKQSPINKMEPRMTIIRDTWLNLISDVRHFSV